MKGLDFRSYGNKILKKVFEGNCFKTLNNVNLGTPLSSLNVALVGSNAILTGKDLSALKTIVTETDKLNWIVPLGRITADFLSNSFQW